MSAAFAIVGRIRKPHGIRGDVIVDPSTDEPAEIFAAGRRVYRGTEDGVLVAHDGTRAPTAHETAAYPVLHARPFKNALIVALAGLADRNAAEAARGECLLVPVEELSAPAEGEVWEHELPGMRVVQLDGSEVGTVSDVMLVPQGLILEVATPQRVVSIPFVDAIVTRVDRDARTIAIDPPPGLLEL